MEYETSYDIGAKPFNHDNHRGKWESSKDFLFACVGNAFKIDIITVLPFVIFQGLGFYALIPYLIIFAVCVVPIVFIQSFLGQFSSTGFVSVFRIAPLFKGIGYVSLAVNFVNLTYYSVFSAIPLFYFVNSLRPTIPWSCEGSSKWMNINQTICNKEAMHEDKIPSVEFFRDHFNFTGPNRNNGTTFSFQLMICTGIVWSIVTLVLLKPTELIGRYIRYSFLVVITIMSLCLLRFIFLPGAIETLFKGFETVSRRNKPIKNWLFIPLLMLSTLGPGWGSIITMASFNNFKTNIYRYSWMISLSQLGIVVEMGCIIIILQDFLKITTKTPFSKSIWITFLRIPSSLTFLELPNLWSLFFFGMLGLGSLNLLVIQLLSLLTSIFDEFENLREAKRIVILEIVAILVMTSMLFCSNYGVYLFEFLSKLTGLIQVVLNLLLLLVVLWVYGRERFQRDLNFMTSHIYSTWMVYVVRFITPLFLLFGFLISFAWLVFSEVNHKDSPLSAIVLISIAVLFLLLISCLIPGYCIFEITHTVGNIGVRLRRCVRPTDWYPADPIDKQSYEERFSSTDTSHPLTILTEE